MCNKIHVCTYDCGCETRMITMQTVCRAVFPLRNQLTRSVVDKTFKRILSGRIIMKI